VKFVGLVLAFALAACSGCSKTHGADDTPDTAPPPLPACTTTLHVVPTPADWRTYVIAARGDSIDATRNDSPGETTYTSDIGLGDFVVRSTFGKTPVPAGPLIVRPRSCAGAEISANPYWNTGPLTLRKSGNVHVISWRAGGAAVDEPLIAFRRE
jgi:hypothetical protein